VSIGLLQFVVFVLYYILLKAIILFINVETRRNGWTVPAGLTGLLS
jgi:hypothetical protein